MPDGLKHVIFGGYLRDVPLVQDYLGTINESHQQIEIISFECLDSKVHVPADLAVSGTVVPLHFAPGIEEGYYLLNFKEPATFQSMDQDGKNVLDDADDGDIMIVEGTDPRLSDVMLSDFGKEILGVAEGSSKGKATATSSRKQADKGKKPMRDVSQPVAKSKTKSKNDIFSRLLAKSAATPLMAAVVVEETQESSTSSSSDADYYGLLDVAEGSNTLKRVRTTDSTSIKKPKKTKTELLKFMAFIFFRLLFISI